MAFSCEFSISLSFFVRHEPDGRRGRLYATASRRSVRARPAWVVAMRFAHQNPACTWVDFTLPCKILNAVQASRCAADRANPRRSHPDAEGDGIVVERADMRRSAGGTAVAAP
jgi:hypothetical protein